ncbi:Glutathione S-transferase epsilon 3 [Operophtera brumata]|uniref:Glutathione S-transferase epsilon 3 n=1 Tax=Operophtera brumata TaxID=104452 RepID=A0A0L7KSI2_OPEBR|nr:Glutathione S-transferase epsilon 3 [Operophtera brumata]
MAEKAERSFTQTRAIVDQCMFFNAGVFFIRLKVVALPTLMQGLRAPSQQHLDDIDAAYSVVEAYLQNREYIATDHPTFPRAASWLARLERDPSFVKYSEPGDYDDDDDDDDDDGGDDDDDDGGGDEY